MNYRMISSAEQATRAWHDVEVKMGSIPKIEIKNLYKRYERAADQKGLFFSKNINK